MFQVEPGKVVPIISLCVALMIISIAVVFVIDVHFSLDPWGDADVESLWYFLLGSIFFPGALRSYRADRLAEQKVPWYYRRDLILCLIGLVSGPLFALSVVQKWVWSVLMSANSPAFSEGSLTALAIVGYIVNFCWIALIVLFIYQAIKQLKQEQKDVPPMSARNRPKDA